MVKLNRIGYKLGLAGAVGIMLAIGMVANQWLTESAVAEVNALNSVQHGWADTVLAAAISIRQIQLAGGNSQLARTPAEVEKSLAEMRQFQAIEEKQIDAALAVSKKAINLERLQKIKVLMQNYASGIEELAKVQTELFVTIDKRSAMSAEWEKVFSAQLASPALATLANRQQIEALLYKTDSRINGLRAAAWRLGVTGEASQRDVIARSSAAVTEDLGRIRHLADDKVVQDGMESLASIVTRITAANDAIIKLEDSKVEIIKNRTVTFVTPAVELIEAQIAFVQGNAKTSKARAIAETAQANQINFGLAIVVVLSLLGSVAFGFLGVARPIARLNNIMAKMAANDLDVVVPGASRGDEIGEMAGTVEGFRANAIEVVRLKAGLEATEKRTAAEQKATMRKLADDFEGAVGEIVETVSSASTELEASAGTLTATAERSQELATMVAAASEEASSNVQSVASATEELTSSVNEISRQVHDSSRMANEAVDQARKTNDRVSELSKAAARIGDVVELINTIAGQTNLLALNATIEAARAGEAGRGFAVVASEVKALAEQTAKATGEIGQQITGIQAATQESVNAIKEISGTIEKLSEISATIASAVEEQGAATQEISRNVQQAARGTQQVSSNITDVQRGASETGSASSQVLSAAQSLSGESHRLKLEVGKFLNSVRAA